MSCVICGLDCGPLKGRVKSWRCAGLMAHRTRDEHDFGHRDELRRRFSNPEKAAARESLLPELMALRPGSRVLDLYGGGLSAEWIKATRPDVDLVVAESDRRLWAALKRDAVDVGFTPVLGDFDKASGPFAMIWLDLCGDAITAFDAVRRAKPLLASRPRMQQWMPLPGRDHVPSVLYVTIMEHSRRGYSELSRETRDIAVTALLDHAGGCLLLSKKVHEYSQSGGKGRAAIWAVGESYVGQLAALAQVEAERLEDAEDHHREPRRNYWTEIKSGRDQIHARGRVHAEGSCACARKGWVSYLERKTDREEYYRYWDDHRYARGRNAA